MFHNAIEIKDLTFKYNAGSAFETTALDKINLSVEKGAFVGLIGHTGSGKSTLIQHMNALLKPTSGVVLIDGEDINADKSNRLSVRQKVGLVFQYPEHQLFELSVMKDVCFGPKNLGLTPDEAKLRAEQALEIVGIPESMYEKSPFDLSGGQKRRIAIAGVLAMNPQILILDEPTAGLDPHGRDEILESISKMHNQLNITVILVSHNMEELSLYVDQIVVMHHGSIKFKGTTREVFSHAEELEQIGLAAPQISYLMKKLNQNGFNVPTDVFTVSEAADVIFSALRHA